MEFFGINATEFVVLATVVVLVLGPKGLAQALAAFRRGVEYFRTLSARLREESGMRDGAAALGELGLKDLDLRQYDPREILRQAVREEMTAWTTSVGTSATPDGNAPATPPGSTEDRTSQGSPS